MRKDLGTMEKKVVLKEMEPKDRISYIWDYYKWYIIGITFAVIFVIYLIISYATRKEEVAHILMVNADLEAVSDDDNRMFDELLSWYGYDTAKQEVVVNNGLHVDPTGVGQNNYYTFSSILTILEAGGAEVYMSDRETFDLIGATSNLQDLSMVLPEELMEKYEDKLVYATDEETKQTYPCGIEITGNEWTKETGLYSTDCVIGAAYGANEDGLTEKLISYILGENESH